MKFLGGLLLGLVVGVAATWFLTSTEIGRGVTGQVVDAVKGWLPGAADSAENAARELTREASVDDLIGGAQDALARADKLAAALADGIEAADLAQKLEDSARSAGAVAGALAIEASRRTLAAARSLPDIDELGDSLSGWQQQLAAYELALRADDVDEADAEASEKALEAAFAPSTRAGPGAGEAFMPHDPFYECPVMMVSNAGPVDADRRLQRYTPWVDTPAGVLIRAPVEAACLSSGYGARDVEGASKNHAGVDYYNRDGGTIYAAGDGVVTLAQDDDAYGTSVKIDHGEGVESHYCHMVPGSLRVKTGDHVRLGQPIGQMGRSGRAYAVHLHYELRFAGETVDPLNVGRRAVY